MKIKIKRLVRGKNQQDEEAIDAAPNQHIPVSPVEMLAIDREGLIPTKVTTLADGVLVQWGDGFSVVLVSEEGSADALAIRVIDFISNNGFSEETVLHPYMMWTSTWNDDPLDFAPLSADQPFTLQSLNWDGLARTSKPSNPPTIDDSSVAVSEEGLKTGQPDTIGNPSDSTNSASTTGQLAVSDPDGDPVTIILGSPSETLTSQGVPIVWTGAGTHILQGSAGSVPVITVSITDSGAYTVTILGPIDHPDVMSEDVLAFITPVTVTDSAGLTDTGTLTVTIEDDALTIGSVTTQTVDEEGLVGGNAGDSYSSGDATGEALTASASLNISWGADNADNDALAGATGDRTVTFNASQPGLAGLTSDGAAVSVAILSNGTLVGYTGTVTPTATSDASVVFFATLNDDTNGSYQFTLKGNLDHPLPNTEDDFNLTFAFTAKDSDGDTQSGSFTVLVDDDALTIGSVTTQTVDEEGLVGGNAGDSYSSGDATGEALTASASLNISWGADNADNDALAGATGDRTVTFNASQPGLSALSSDGAAVSVAILSNGTLVGYTGTVTPTATSDASVVFFATLNDDANGSYQFTLKGNLDHPVASTEDDLNLTFAFTAKDSDGDTQSGSFTIIVDDDALTIGSVTTQTVDEEGLVGGNAGDSYSSGDATGEALTATASLNISWGADNADNDALAGATGDRTVTFNASQPGLSALSSDGAAVSVAILSNGTLVGYTGAVAPTATSDASVVFFATLNDDANGSYQFTLKGNLDHPVASTEDDLNLTFAFTAKDSDGDTQSGSFTVLVDDDALTIGSVTTQTVDEEGLVGGNAGDSYSSGDATGEALTATASLNISWGADNADNDALVGATGDRTVTFNVSQPGLAGLTSDGAAVSVAILSNGTLVGYTGTVTPTATSDASVVFFATLNDDANGSYQFTLKGNLDHPVASTEDDLSLVFNFTAKDSDGDTQSGSFTVLVDDDALAIGSVTTQTVDEEGLVGGNAGDSYSSGDATGEALTATASLNISWGADNADNDALVGATGDRTVTFNASQPGLSALSSDGAAVSVAILSNGTLVGYTGTVTPTATSDASVVFFATLNDDANGSYQFTLKGNLDHPVASTEDDLNLTFAFTAKDSDGDTQSGSFTIIVDDDALTIGSVTTQTVDEEGLVGGNAGDSYSSGDATGEALTATASLNISWGADNADNDALAGATGDRTVTFNASQPGLSALSSDGAAVSVAILSNGTLVGYTGAVAPTATSDASVVFFATLNDDANGSYQFTLKGNLDHSVASTEDDLSLVFNFTAKDSDGDTQSGSFTVLVDDDALTIGSIITQTVDEEGLVGGNAGDSYSSGDATGEALTATASLNISWGADNADNDALAGATGDRTVTFNASQPGLSALSSDGAAVSVAILSNGTLVGYTGAVAPTATSDASVVFFATLNDDANGSYQFTLKGNLDHPVASTEDDLNLTFAFTAKDSDGDTQSGSFTVLVDDDALTIGSVTTQTVDEEGLVGGNAGDSYSSGDATGEALTATASLNISWGADNADNDALVGATGDRTVTFNVSQPGLAGLTSDGAAVSVAILSNGTLVGYTGTVTPTATSDASVVFFATLNDDANGSYQFTLKGNLDHPVASTEDDLSLVFNFTAKDSDGDTQSGSFTVLVDDDALAIGSVTTQTVDEEGLVGGNAGDSYSSGDATGEALTATASLNISWGADNADNDALVGATGDRTVTFNVSQPGLAGLTSDGAAVSVAILSNGTLVGYTGTVTPTATSDASVVFFATLNDDANGSYQFTLKGNLDHPVASTEDDLNLTFAFTAKDSDGDTQSGSFTVLVDDDALTIGSVTTQTVDEEGLVGGNAGDSYSSGDATGEALTASASLNISWGADNADNDALAGATGDRTVTFNASQPGLAGLTSDGAAVSVAILSNGTLVGYTGTVTPTATSDASVVFFATLNDDTNGSYQFTLKGNLDHPLPNTEDDFNLTFAFTAKDSDGDTQSGSFTVLVDDDALTIGSVTTQTVDEEGLVGGNAGDSYSSGDATGEALTASASLNISWGADNADNDALAGATGDRTVTFNASQPGLSALSSDGAAVSVAILSNGTLVGYTGAVAPTATSDASVVFFATLNDDANGSYQFTLKGNLDHSVASTEDDLSLVFNFTAKDSDGDTQSGSFTVLVDDDALTIGSIITQTVDEEGLVGGNAGDSYSSGDATGEALTATASLNISWGADNADNDALAGATGDRTVTFNVSQPGLSALSSDGAAVSVAILSNGTLVGYTGAVAPTATSDASVVFFATLNDDANGSYQFTLKGNLDHPVASTEDDLSLVFNFTAKDSDGDTQSGSFTIVVDDDAPIITVLSANVTLDETAGIQNANGAQDTFNPLPTAFASELVGLIELGHAHSASGAAVYSCGADGFSNVKLTDVNGINISGLDSGLTTASSSGENHIFLYTSSTNDNVILGREGAVTTANPTGSVVFAVYLDPTDHSLWLAQFMSIQHDISSIPDTSEPASFSNKIFITATDGDGDSATSNGSLTVTFLDDGPTASIALNGTPVLSVDESDGAGVTGEVDPLGGHLGSTTLLGANLFADTSVFGSDGAAGSGARIYSLNLLNSGPTGLNDSITGLAVTLFESAGVIEGRSGTLSTDPLVFTLSINPTTGNTTLTQWRAVMHDTASLVDTSEPKTLNSNLIGIKVVVTDRDGDTSAATVNLNGVIQFLDDGPLAIMPETEILVNQAGADSIGSLPLPTLDADGNIDNNYGSDGQADFPLKHLAFTGLTEGEIATGIIDGETVNLTVSGKYVRLHLVDHDANPNTPERLEGWIDGLNVGTKIFQITLNHDPTNTTNDTWRSELFAQIGATSNEVVQAYDFSSLGSNSQSFKVLNDPNTGGTDNDILFSSYQRNSLDVTDISTGGEAVSANSNGIGVQNSHLDDTDNIRLDFAHNVTHSSSNNNTYDYTSHYNIQGFSFAIVALQGNTDPEASEVWVRIYNKQDNDPTGTSTVTHQVALHTLQSQLGIVRIDWYDASTGITSTLNLTTLTSDGLGGYLISGLDLNDRITVFGPDVGFNALEIENPISGAHGITDSLIGSTLLDGTLNGDSFDIGAFQYVEINTLLNIPTINLNYDLVITDRDGDQASGTINLILNTPSVPPVVLDLNGDGLHFLTHNHPQNQALFDFNGDGRLERPSWIDPNDGLLVFDVNADHKVNGPLEFVFASGNLVGSTDMAAIRMLYDTNGDGCLSAADSHFELFGVWRDVNGNGISDDGELHSLYEAKIISINLNSDGNIRLDANGEVMVHGQSLYFRADGSSGIVGDVALTSYLPPSLSAVGELLSPPNAHIDFLVQEESSPWTQHESTVNDLEADPLIIDSSVVESVASNSSEETVIQDQGANVDDSILVQNIAWISSFDAADSSNEGFVQAMNSVAIVQDAPPAIG